MKYKIYIYIGIILFIGLFLIVGTFTLKGKKDKSTTVNLIQPSTKELSSEISVSGKLDYYAKQFVYLDNELSVDGYKINVETGDIVEKGTTLVSYNKSSISNEIALLNLDIENSYMQINHIKEQQEAVDSKYEKKQLNFDRRKANNELKRLQLQKEHLKEQESKYSIHSNISGYVINVTNNTYENPENPLIQVASKERYKITGTLTEFDVLELNIGQKVKILSDAIPDEEFEGRVISINDIPKQNEESEITEYEFTVSLENIDNSESYELRPGYKMLMYIQTDKKNTLTVPKDVVFTENEDSYVYVSNNNIVERRYIKIGISTEKKFEVIKGINEADLVISPRKNQDLYEGMEVSRQ